jgi:potassium/hydrogen antiporter
LGSEFVLGIVVGFALGFGIGGIALFISKYLKLDIKGLYPLILLSLAMITIGVADHMHANLLLAMYVAGITIGNGHLQFRSYSINFFESISWLMEISLMRCGLISP